MGADLYNHLIKYFTNHLKTLKDVSRLLYVVQRPLTDLIHLPSPLYDPNPQLSQTLLRPRFLDFGPTP